VTVPIRYASEADKTSTGLRILYGVQATGNGHISRAKEVIPHLLRHGRLDVLLSGDSAEVDIGYPVSYRLTGLGFTFGRNGGIDYVDTLRKLRPIRFLRDVRALDVDAYDVVVSDFEPVTAWACKRAGKPCVGLSNQASFLSDKTPRPAVGDLLAECVFRSYAPCTYPVGLHYEAYDTFIRSPIIRSEVRRLNPVSGGHIILYLPAYGEDAILPHLRSLGDLRFHVFSKHTDTEYVVGNVWVRPVRNDDYLGSLESCDGLISGGGFGATAEALYLGKRLMVIPMRDQFEQKCNAEALKRYGIPVLDAIETDFPDRIRAWNAQGPAPRIAYPDHTAAITAHVVERARTTRACNEADTANLSFMLE
jgi:uncharacterized protein (TIGR00661 family)